MNKVQNNPSFGMAIKCSGNLKKLGPENLVAIREAVSNPEIKKIAEGKDVLFRTVDFNKLGISVMPKTKCPGVIARPLNSIKNLLIQTEIKYYSISEDDIVGCVKTTSWKLDEILQEKSRNYKEAVRGIMSEIRKTINSPK